MPDGEIAPGALAAGLRELAEREAATPEGRERVAAALRETLAAVEANRPRPFVTPGIASALRDLADGLTVAAAGAAHIADHAAVILPPQ